MNEYLSMDQLARILSHNHRLPKFEAREIIDLIFLTISNRMSNGIETRIPRFGVFFSHLRPEKMVMNPRKRKMVWGKEKRIPHVRWSSRVMG
jgi:nucleoid DNA-binding protein